MTNRPRFGSRRRLSAARDPDLADWLDLPADAAIDIEYVVAEKTPGHGVIGSYTSGQAEAIQGSIRWRFTTIRDWRGTHAPTVERLPLRTMPSGSKGASSTSQGQTAMVGEVGASSRRAC